MKNLIKLQTKVKCWHCSTRGFFTQRGYDCDNDCPMCGESSTMVTLMDKTKLTDTQMDDIICDYYCSSCRILFDEGCTHAENGCDSSIYNAHIIGKCEYKGETYIGMPQFDSQEELIKVIRDIKVLEIVCPNEGMGSCPNASYPETTHPQYYKHMCKRIVK